MNELTSHDITFESRELTSKLSLATQEVRTGYWQFDLANTSETSDSKTSWYLAICQGRIVFSGDRPLSWQALCQTLQRYLPELANARAKQTLQTIEQNSTPQELTILSKMLLKIEKELGLERQSIIKAIQLKILSDFDTYLFDSAGSARFTPNNDLIVQNPITGFQLEDLLVQAKKRHEEWENLKRDIPSMLGKPILNGELMSRSNLNEKQKQLVQKLCSLGKPLSKIAEVTAKDPLDTAKMFANLIQSGLVSLQLPPQLAAKIAEKDKVPEVFIIDDSTLFLQKFQSLVTKWGYKVNVWTNTSTVIQKMLASSPSIVFVDVNMPGMSGFDLIKEVRRQPQLAALPLVLLTAENSLSNQWRAKWGNCKFLAKPRSPEEVANFQVELRNLLNESVPLNQ